MHARETIELAILLATHGETIVHGIDQFSPHSLQRYWIASRCRLDRWATTLKQFSSTNSEDNATLQKKRWRPAHTAIQEILISELLTRTWTAVGVIHDRLHGTNDVEPVLRGVLVGQLEARHRALSLMIHGRGFSPDQTTELNGLRRRMERYTDLLLSRLLPLSNVTEFGFDNVRIQDFAEDSKSHDGRQRALRWQITVAALRASQPFDTYRHGANGDLNERVAAGVLCCLPENLFDSTGLFKSLWLIRLTQNAEDTQGLIDDLLAIDGPAFDSVSPTELRSGSFFRDSPHDRN